jgi:hypothetical protein
VHRGLDDEAVKLLSKRWGFVGEPAEGPTASLYIRKRVPDRYRTKGGTRTDKVRRDLAGVRFSPRAAQIASPHFSQRCHTSLRPGMRMCTFMSALHRVH